MDGEEVDVDDMEKEEALDNRICTTNTEKKGQHEFDFDAQINKELTPQDRKEFRAALEEFEGCFAKTDDQLGRCNVTEHEIHLTPNARPIYQAPRPTSWKEQAILSKHTDDMLKKGVIERSTGPWCARTLLAQKKDGTWRFCLDFRPLSGVTIFSVYPMPSIDGALTRLRGAKIFSVMDLESGYWQIPLRKEDREKTAFATADGVFQFLVMPFGLCTAQSTFQRTMDMVLGGLRWTSCLVYIDDIIVYAADTTEHIRRLRLVLAALQKAKLKLPKCRFGEAAITALGHRVNAEGISPDPEKVRAICEFPLPPAGATRVEKIKWIKSYLGICSYYRKHVPGFSEVAKPLFDLTKEKSLFIWTAAHQESFDRLKEMLADAATLAYPDPEAAFEIHPDACGYGIGVVLLQKQEGTERPLAFASRLMSSSEKNYSITEKECLALIWAIKKFRPYIFGCPIKIVTDHHALCWLQSKADLAGRLARWSMVLTEYKYTIAHKNGRLHNDADALSRYPVTDSQPPTPPETDAEPCWPVNTLTQNNRDALVEGQRAEWGYVFKNEENGKETANYVIDNGLVSGNPPGF